MVNMSAHRKALEEQQEEPMIEEDPLVGFFEETMLSKTVARKKSKAKRTVTVEDIRPLLISSWKEKEAKRQKLAAATEDEANEVNLSELLQEASEIGTVRKDNVFKEAITTEDQQIIDQRVAAQRKSYYEYEKRELLKKLIKVQHVHPYVTEEECKYALKECNDDEEEVVMYFTDYFNLQNIRKKIALDAEKANRAANPHMIDVTDSGMFITRPRKNKTSSPSRNRTSGALKEGNKYVYRKLRLDDALKQNNFEGWSEARIKAYKLKDKNPNAYYYRFNDPGEQQRNGPWTKEEIILFYKRMEEMGVSGQWGVFAMAIPGRVGYQCSNFYRQLIETGKIEDENYVVDDKGKAHYRFKNGKTGRGPARTDVEPVPRAPVVKGKKKKGRKRKAKFGDGDEEGEEDVDDEEYMPSKRRGGKDDGDEEEEGPDPNNPLPGFIDAITLEEVTRPAISPSGHVMSYSTWSRCLMQEPRNICPMTKQPLKKRELTLLTWENIDQYRDKIIWDTGLKQ